VLSNNKAFCSTPWGIDEKEEKKMKISAFGCILLIAILAVGLQTATAGALLTDKINSPQPIVDDSQLNFQTVSGLTVDQAITSSGKNWTLLTVDQEGKKIKLDDLSKCDISTEEKQTLATNLENIWKKYPVSVIRTKDQISISFDPNVKATKLTIEEDTILGRIDAIQSDYLNRKYNSSALDWANIQGHPDIVYIACTKWGIPANQAGWAAETADDPDYWTPIIPPLGFEPLDALVRALCHSWDHYYNPVGIPPTGYAPLQCGNYGNIAKNAYPSDPYTAFTNLGYSSHFISDVGNPMHTGYEAEQAIFQWTHSAYEGYVYTNWVSGHNFKQILVQTNYYYPTNDLTAQTIGLAQYSHGNLGTLWWEVYNSNGQIQDNVNVMNITDNVLYQTEMRVLGLVRYVLD
jgi:hypothetical protein